MKSAISPLSSRVMPACFHREALGLSETKDLAGRNPEIVEALRKQYNAWFDDMQAHARWERR